nr:hypothetical protein [Tanacetum cinerariifolium]
LDTFSSVRRPRHRDVIWKKKGSSNTSNVGLSAVSVSNLNKNVKRYFRKDLLACNNSHLGETSSAYMCNDAMNVSCDYRMNELLDDNNFFIFDDVNVRISPVSKMPFRKKPRDSMHVPVCQEKYCFAAVCQIVQYSGLSSSAAQQRIHLYCLRKDNGENILKSIDKGSFKMGKFRETLAEGALHLGSERDRVFTDLTPEEKERFKADIHAMNILLQGLPKDIYTLINHYTDAKDIWDNVKMLLEEAPIQYLALNEDNVFQANQCDAFDFDVDDASTIETLFMENLSSADPIYDDAGPSYDSDILSEVQDYDNYLDSVEQNKRFRAENEKVKQHYKELYDSIKITRAKTIEKTASLLTKNEKLKAQLKGKMKCITMDTVTPKVLAPSMYAIDVESSPPHNRNNREVHLDYLKHLKESIETLRETVEEARTKTPLDNALANTCFYTKRSQELLEYVIDTCLKEFNKKLLWIFAQDNMSRDVITVGLTMRIPLLYRGEYSQWRKMFMNYLEEQTDGEAMINSIQNCDQPLPVIAQVSLSENAQNAPPTLKGPKFWTAEDKKTRKIDRLSRSLLIQGLPNDIYSLIDSNKTAKDLCDALERPMRGSEYGEQDTKAAILYEYETFKAIEGEQLLDTYLRYLQVINDLKKCGYKKDNYVNNALGYKKKAVVVTSDQLALVAEKTNVCKRKEKVVVSSDSEGSDDKKVEKKADEKKRDLSKVKCYNYKKEGHFAKYCKQAKVKDYKYYKTKMLLAKKDSDEQVLLAEDQAWMESSSDSD